MKIVYIIEKDLNFPLIEWLRKEVFLYAETLKKLKPHYDITIVNLNKWKNVNINWIKIVNKNIFNIYFNKSDIIHYFWQPSAFLTLILLFSKFNKFYINILDWEAWHFWKSIFSKTSINLINRHANNIFIQTKHQYSFIKNYFSKNKIKFLSPLIPNYKQICKKNKNPTLFFMWHFSKYKWIYEQLKAYEKLIKKYPKLEFVIANSWLNKKTDNIVKIINEINKNWWNIILKWVIDPEEELSKSWIYFYTYTKVHNTFAIPLSLYEANRCNTFFITGNIWSNNDFFNEKFLLKKLTTNEIIEKTEYILDNYKNLKVKEQLKLKIENNNIINTIIKEYEK